MDEAFSASEDSAVEDKPSSLQKIGTTVTEKNIVPGKRYKRYIPIEIMIPRSKATNDTTAGESYFNTMQAIPPLYKELALDVLGSLGSEIAADRPRRSFTIDRMIWHCD